MLNLKVRRNVIMIRELIIIGSNPIAKIDVNFKITIIYSEL